MAHSLKGIMGPVSGREFLLPDDGELTLGRGKGLEISVSDSRLSRRHCTFYASPDGVQVDDLDSENGTFVNGNKVFSRHLEDGDQIAVGNCVLIYQAREGKPRRGSSSGRAPRKSRRGSGSGRSPRKSRRGSGSGSHPRARKGRRPDSNRSPKPDSKRTYLDPSTARATGSRESADPSQSGRSSSKSGRKEDSGGISRSPTPAEVWKPLEQEDAVQDEKPEAKSPFRLASTNDPTLAMPSEGKGSGDKSPFLLASTNDPTLAMPSEDKDSDDKSPFLRASTNDPTLAMPSEGKDAGGESPFRPRAAKDKGQDAGAESPFRALPGDRKDAGDESPFRRPGMYKGTLALPDKKDQEYPTPQRAEFDDPTVAFNRSDVPPPPERAGLDDPTLAMQQPSKNEQDEAGPPTEADDPSTMMLEEVEAEPHPEFLQDETMVFGEAGAHRPESYEDTPGSGAFRRVSPAAADDLDDGDEATMMLSGGLDESLPGDEATMMLSGDLDEPMPGDEATMMLSGDLDGPMPDDDPITMQLGGKASSDDDDEATMMLDGSGDSGPVRWDGQQADSSHTVPVISPQPPQSKRQRTEPVAAPSAGFGSQSSNDRTQQVPPPSVGSGHRAQLRTEPVVPPGGSSSSGATAVGQRRGRRWILTLLVVLLLEVVAVIGLWARLGRDGARSVAGQYLVLATGLLFPGATGSGSPNGTDAEPATGSADPRRIEATLVELREAHEEDDAKAIARLEAKLLGYGPTTAAPLCRKLQAIDPFAAERLERSASRLFRAFTNQQLFELLTAEMAQVRDRAEAALVQRPGAAGLDFLDDKLSAAEDPELAGRLVRILGQMRDHLGVPILKKVAARHPHIEIRLLAARTLHSIGGEPQLEYLRQLEKKTSNDRFATALQQLLDQ